MDREKEGRIETFAKTKNSRNTTYINQWKGHILDSYIYVYKKNTNT